MAVGRERLPPSPRRSVSAQTRPFSACSGRAPTWEITSAAAMPPRRAHSASGLLLDEGIFGRSTAELDPDYVAKIRKRAAAAILMLRTADSDATAKTGRRPSVLVHAVVCYEVDAATWGTADLRNLEHGLEALVTLFGIGSSCKI